MVVLITTEKTLELPFILSSDLLNEMGLHSYVYVERFKQNGSLSKVTTVKYITVHMTKPKDMWTIAKDELMIKHSHRIYRKPWQQKTKKVNCMRTREEERKESGERVGLPGSDELLHF